MEVAHLWPPWLSGSYHIRSPWGDLPQRAFFVPVCIGLGRIVVLLGRSSTSYQICEHIRCLYFNHSEAKPDFNTNFSLA